MKRRWAALALCLLLLVSLPLPTAEAAEDVYFTAVEDTIMSLSDATMPFWSGGYLYIPASIFTGTMRKVWGVRYQYVESEQFVILSHDDGRILFFDLDSGDAKDIDGATVRPGALRRNGVVFVPAYAVTRYFNLVYSVMDVDHGHLVWLRQQGSNLSDEAFANAAVYPMASRYAEYQRNKQASGQPGETPDVGTEIDGKRVYLCMTGGSNTSAMLDALDRYDAQAAFFCGPEFLETRGDLLRRMTVTGQTIGLLVDGADPARSVLEQLEAGNRALARATCGGTRLVFLQNASEEDRRVVREAGYSCLEPELDRSKHQLKSVSNANSLLQRVSVYREEVTVWLADTADVTGLRAFLSANTSAEGRCLALTETS